MTVYGWEVEDITEHERQGRILLHRIERRIAHLTWIQVLMPDIADDFNEQIERLGQQRDSLQILVDKYSKGRKPLPFYRNLG